MTLAAAAPKTATVADAIEQTLEWLDKQGCAERDHERRQAKRGRYRAQAKITYFPAGFDGEKTFEVTTRNLSREGLSFIHKTLIYPRQHVQIQLPLPDHSVRQIRGKVVRVRPAGIGLYEIGIEFTEVEVAIA
jgi:hypothetical protein